MALPYSRNLESQGLFIQRWLTGLITQRSPLYTPISALGLQLVARQDALIDGLNMEISTVMTLIRRPAFTRFCPGAFSAQDFPLNYYSFQNTSGTIYPLVDTPAHVYNFTNTFNKIVLSKSAGAGRGDFFRVGDYVYYCNGVDVLFWDGTSWKNWGIVAPTVTPTVTLTAGSLSPTAGYTYVYCYVNTVTGHVSAASPASTNTGPQTSQNFVVHYTGSTDAQVNAIWIFRTLDGGGIYYFLTSVPNATSTFTDSIADGSLNTFIVAPLAPGNAPCPVGSSLVTFWDGRLWVAAKNILYWTQGPQVVTGLGEQSFNLSTNFFKLPINIKGFAPTTNGLLVFTSDTTWVVTGSGGIYFINPWQKNFGIKTPNAVTQDGDLVFVVTSRGQLFQIGGGLTEIGLNIRGKISAMNPNNVSLTLHRNGADEGIFLSDGATTIYRYSLTFGCWSPAAKPVQGAGIIGSIETSDANWTLLLGATTGGKFIGGRNLTSFTDDGGTYTCSATVGSLIIGPPGSKNNIEAVCLYLTQTGSYPAVSVMINEINTTSGQGFSTLPNPIDEPPALAGSAFASQTIFAKRHHLKAGNTITGLPIPQQVEHIQVKIAFNSENFGGELLGLAVI